MVVVILHLMMAILYPTFTAEQRDPPSPAEYKKGYQISQAKGGWPHLLQTFPEIR
jgi:hypothetical protein